MDLKEYLDTEGTKYGVFAKKIGISYARLWKIMQRNSDILLSTAMAIEKATRRQVTCKDLLSKPKIKEVKAKHRPSEIEDQAS